MTEAEWMACTAPEPLLEILHNQTIEERKYRLFACACCRRIWHLLDGRSQRLIEVVERYMAGLSDAAARATAAKHHGDVLREATPYTPSHAIAPIVHMARPGVGAAWALAWNAVSETRRALRLHSLQADAYRECQVQATILREVIGNPSAASASIPPYAAGTMKLLPDWPMPSTMSKRLIAYRSSLMPWKKPAAPTRTS
jgi:hypothetical protein